MSIVNTAHVQLSPRIGTGSSRWMHESFTSLAVLGFAFVAISVAQEDDGADDVPDDIPDDADAVRERSREIAAFVTGTRHLYVETKSRFQSENLDRYSRHRFLASISPRLRDEAPLADRLTFRFERQSAAVIADGDGETDFAADALDDPSASSESRVMMSERLAAVARDSFINGASRQLVDRDITGAHRRARMRVRVSDLSCYDVAEGAEVVDEDATQRWILNEWEDWDCERFDEDGNVLEGEDADDDEEDAAKVHHVTCGTQFSADDGCNVTVTLYFSREPRTVGEGEDAVTIDARELKWDIKADNCICPNVTDRLGYGIQTRARAHRIRSGEEIWEDGTAAEIVGELDGVEVDGEQPRFRFRQNAVRPESCGSAVERPTVESDTGVDEEDDEDDASERTFARYESNRRFIFLVQDDNSCSSAHWDPSIGTLSSEDGQSGNFPLIPVIGGLVAVVAVVAVGAMFFMKARK